MGNCSDCSSICGKEGETGEFNMTVSLASLLTFTHSELNNSKYEEWLLRSICD